MPNLWPPPPDLASIQELVRAADPEGLLALGAPADEYELEEKQILGALSHLPSGEILTSHLLPIIERIWRKSFALDEAALATRRPALLSLAKEIERFFGPESQPRTRKQILADDHLPT